METWEALAKALADQVRAEIAAAGMSGRALSQGIGIANPTLSRYLNGSRDMPVSVLVRIGQYVGVPPAVIFERAYERATRS